MIKEKLEEYNFSIFLGYYNEIWYNINIIVNNVMYIKTIRHYHKIKNKRILLRASLNVPIKNGRVKDDFRLQKQLATIRFLHIQGAKIIIIGHLGRPQGGIYDKSLSLLPIALYLQKKLNIKVNFVKGKINLKTASVIAGMRTGDIVVLDNLRFNQGETINSKKLAKTLASLADIYVCDAFANAHRAHASMDKVKMYLPAFAGLLMEEELTNLHLAWQPHQPLMLVLGGAKIATKLPLIKQFKNKAKRIVIGGALANNFLLAQGISVGKSLIDKQTLAFARKYKKNNLLLPIDVVVAKNNQTHKGTIKKIQAVKQNEYIFDIGPQTIKLYTSVLKKANTIIWNGPMGFFESRAFRYGTMAIATAVARRSQGECFGIAGGGETIEAIKLSKQENNIDWLSTGGGAMLAYLGGKYMPGLTKIVR